MAYTRIYPLAARSYSPAANPLIKQIKLTLTDGGNTITGVNTSITGVAAVGWYAAIISGKNSNVFGTYRISVIGAGTLTITKMDGTAVVWPVGTTASDYVITAFSNLLPSELDGAPEAFCLSVVGAGPLKIITAAGQYYEMPAGSMVAGAIYSIAIREVVNVGGCSGYLLGSTGIMGSGIIG